MMMRQIVSYLIAALICLVSVTANPAFGAVAEDQNLTKVLSLYQDTHMTVEDLAFFLATHSYNATPKEGYVQITIGRTVYRAVPNSTTGLAKISIMN